MTDIQLPGHSPEIYTQTTETDPYVYMYAKENPRLTGRYIGRYKPFNGMYEVEYLPVKSLDYSRCNKFTEAEAFCFLLTLAMTICPGIINPSKFSSLHPVD